MILRRKLLLNVKRFIQINIHNFKMVSFVFGIHGPQLDPFSFSSTFSAPSLALVSIANTHPLTGPSLNVRVGVRQLNMGERQKPIEALQ